MPMINDESPSPVNAEEIDDLVRRIDPCVFSAVHWMGAHWEWLANTDYTTLNQFLDHVRDAARRCGCEAETVAALYGIVRRHGGGHASIFNPDAEVVLPSPEKEDVCAALAIAQHLTGRPIRERVFTLSEAGRRAFTPPKDSGATVPGSTTGGSHAQG